MSSTLHECSSVQSKVGLIIEVNNRDNLAIGQEVARMKSTKPRKAVETVTSFTAMSYTHGQGSTRTRVMFYKKKFAIILSLMVSNKHQKGGKIYNELLSVVAKGSKSKY